MQETLFKLQLERMSHYHDIEAAFQRQQCNTPFAGDALFLMGHDFSGQSERLAKVRDAMRLGCTTELESDELLPPVIVAEIKILESCEDRSPAIDAQIARLRKFYS